MKTAILIVDDEIEFAETLAERLQIRNYETRVCASGMKAIEIVGKTGIDVVILDLIMPEMDGFETLKKIKAVKPLTEVIMLSGKATLKMAVEGMERGAFEYLRKPCESTLMIKKIEEAAQRKRKQEERIQRAMAEIEAVVKIE